MEGPDPKIDRNLPYGSRNGITGPTNAAFKLSTSFIEFVNKENDIINPELK
jgi:hypothetical protein